MVSKFYQFESKFQTITKYRDMNSKCQDHGMTTQWCMMHTTAKECTRMRLLARNVYNNEDV